MPSWPFLRPVLLLLAGLALLIALLLLFYQAPRIHRLEPDRARPGDVLVIHGVSMGNDPATAWVSIGGRRVSASEILEWTPSRISLRLPYNVYSGLVSVHTPVGEALGPVFINQDQVPVLDPSAGQNGTVRLQRVVPARAIAGTVVELQGSGFGHRQAGGAILIDGVALDREDIESWTDKRLRFVAPFKIDAAAIAVRTGTSVSAPLPFGIGSGALQVRRGSSRRFLLEQRYSVGDVELSANPSWGAITLYIPQPLPGPGRMAVFDGTGSNGHLQALDDLHLDKFTLANPASVTNYTVASRWRVTLQEIFIDIPAGFISVEAIPGVYERWLRPGPMVPLRDTALSSFVKTWRGDSQSAFDRARALYQAVVAAIEPEDTVRISFAPEVLRDRHSSSFGYASLYTALLRLDGIPARMVEGLVINHQGKHRAWYWVECFIPGIGWLEADPALADQAGEKPVAFGNIDGRHLALIVDGADKLLPRIDDRSQKLYQRLLLMELHGQASGNVESYGLSMEAPVLESLGGSIADNATP